MAVTWRPVKTYEGLYEVSSDGRVRSLPRNGTSKNGRVLKSMTIYNGYQQVVLAKYGKNSPKLVHRLVAQAFIPNPENKPAVNHKDGNTANNSVDNLEWVTHRENMIHSSHVLGNYSGNWIGAPVRCIETGTSYKTIASASRDTGVLRTAIGNCLSGLSKTAGGLHWKRLTRGEITW